MLTGVGMHSTGHVSYAMKSSILVVAMAALSAIPQSGVQADVSVLGRYIGSWDVQVQTRRPAKPDLIYTETYEWVLDGKFIRGRTGRKSDGSEDVIYGTYDVQSKGYPFWVFSSSGSYTYLPPATWNARERLMEWKNPSGWDINYQGRCQFSDDNARSCSLIMKDWKGKVLLEQEWTAIRSAR